MRWHYTDSAHFWAIVKSGCIAPSNPLTGKGERPVVWFSITDCWEPTANFFHGERVRIGVLPRRVRLNWNEFVRRSRVSRAMAKALVDSAKDMGADPANWYVRFSGIPFFKWAAVEVSLDGNSWRRVWEPVGDDMDWKKLKQLANALEQAAERTPTRRRP